MIGGGGVCYNGIMNMTEFANDFLSAWHDNIGKSFRLEGFDLVAVEAWKIYENRHPNDLDFVWVLDPNYAYSERWQDAIDIMIRCGTISLSNNYSVVNIICPSKEYDPIFKTLVESFRLD